MVNSNDLDLEMPRDSEMNAEGELRNLLREMANFIALYETIEDKLGAREAALERRLEVAGYMLTEQLAAVKDSLADFQGIMTEAGAARWRVAAENALKEGTQHLRTLQDTSDAITQTLRENCDRLEKTSSHAVTGIAEASSAFQTAGFKEVAAKGAEQIKDISVSTIKRITKLVNTFHAKNMVMSLGITLFVVFLTCIYINDEWPWEAHSQAAKERSAGQTLMTAWPHLTPVEQQDVIAAGKK